MNATRPCSVAGCDRLHSAKGMCNMHYIRVRLRGDPGEASPRKVRSRSAVCAFVGCGRKHHANSYCAVHNNQRLRGGPVTQINERPLVGSPISERLEALTKRSGACWEWQGWKRSGYGVLYAHRKKQAAHRLSYELAHGDIPIGTEIDHKCRNRACVNPDHLQAVSRVENAQNIGAQKNSSTGYRGVFIHIGRDGQVRYGVRVVANGVRYSGGHYGNAEDANEAAIALRNQVQINNREDWDD